MIWIVWIVALAGDWLSVLLHCLSKTFDSSTASFSMTHPSASSSSSVPSVGFLDSFLFLASCYSCSCFFSFFCCVLSSVLLFF